MKLSGAENFVPIVREMPFVGVINLITGEYI